MKRVPIVLATLLAVFLGPMNLFAAPFDAVINEMSQGSLGNKEWVEILVTVDGLDMRDYEIGDNDDGTWHSLGAFTSDTNWEAVAAGTLIVIYNGGDVDETIAGEDTDFSDKAVLIAHTNTQFFTDASGSWPGSGGFANTDGDDLAAIRDAGDTIVHDMAVTHPGSTISGPGAGEVTFFTEDTTGELAFDINWTTDDSTNATPGLGNGGNNSQWVTDLRAGVTASNEPPFLSPVGNKIATLSNGFSFVVTAFDSTDGDDIELSASGIPAGATFMTVTNAAGVTNAFNWPSPDPVGVYTTTFFAADKDGTNSETITMSVGSIIISEMLRNPDAVSDNDGEWLEVFNVGPVDVDIDGWDIKGAGGSEHVISNGGPLTVPAKGFLVLGRSTTLGVNGGAPVDYSYGSDVSIANSGDTIILANTSGVDVARVTYVSGVGFPSDTPGASMYLRAPELDMAEGTNWATSTVAWPGSAGDLGSPGAANEEGDWGVPPTNVLPVLAVPGDQVVFETETLIFGVSASDADGDFIDIAASNLPAVNASFDATNGGGAAAGTFEFTPSSAQIGDHTVDFYAADKDGIDSNSVTISVLELGGAIDCDIFDDDFEDGDLSGWTQGEADHWTNTDAQAIAGSRSLKHNLSGTSSNSYIYAQPAYDVTSATTIWRVKLSNGAWGPSTANKFWTYLFADSTDLGTGTVANGYAVGVNFTGSSDLLELYRVDAGVPTAIITSSLVWGESMTNGIELTRTTGGDWTLNASTDGTYTHLVPEGNVSDATYTDTTISMGTVFQYTTTRAGLLRLDDVCISHGEAPTNIPPTLVTPGAQNVIVSNTLVFGVSASESDGDLITLTAVNVPANATFFPTNGGGSAAGTFEFTPDGAQESQVFMVEFRANDKDGGDTNIVSITVNPIPIDVTGVVTALINEVEFNGTGSDTNSFIEIVALAGTDLENYFIIHYNGSDPGDSDIFSFTFPSFVVPDDGATDTNGNALGFVVIGNTANVANVDFELPLDMQNGPDGLVLYDAASNVLDAVAWEGPGDLTIDDPGTVSTNGDSRANNYLHLIPDDTVGDEDTDQAPNDVGGDDGSGWTIIPLTPGAINGAQVSGSINMVGGGLIALATNVLPVVTAPGPQTVFVGTELLFEVTVTEGDGDAVTLTASNLPANATFFPTNGSGQAAGTLDFSPVAAQSGQVYTVYFDATDKDGTDSASVDITVDQLGAAPVGVVTALINEVEFNGAGVDTNDFVEIIAPAGTDLNGCFLVHYNGAAGTDGGEFTYTFPAFVVPDDGITDTNGTPLGFAVVAEAGSGVANQDFDLPEGFQGGPDGLVLYDPFTNILDAVAWEGAGDLTDDDPGNVQNFLDPTRNDYLHVTLDDATSTDDTVQAPDNVLGDDGSGWTLIPSTPGAINGGQTSGQIIISGGGAPVGNDQDGDGIPDDVETAWCGGPTNCTPGGATGDGDSFTYLQEYILGYDPTLDDPPFEFDSVNLGSIDLTFGPTTNTRVYTVDFSTNLVEGELGWDVLEQAADGSNGVVTVTDPADDKSRAYRVRVHVP